MAAEAIRQLGEQLSGGSCRVRRRLVRAGEAEPWSHTQIAAGRAELAAIRCTLDVVWRAAREPA